MNHHQLEYFIEVYKRRSLKQAAEYLMISPQGLSKTIKSLERELNVRLFHHTRYAYEPTADAERLLPHAVTITEEYKKIEARDNLFSRKVTLYALDGTLDYFTLELFSDFFREYPNIALKIIETSHNEAIRHVQSREDELALLQSECEYADFKNIYLFECPFCFVIHKSHPLAKRSSISITENAAELDGQAIAGRGFEYILFDRLFKNLNLRNSRPRCVMESNNEKLLLSLAEQNIAIACVSQEVAEKNPSPNTVICSFTENTYNDRIYLSYKTDTVLSREAVIFRDYLLQWIRKHRHLN